ncbi:uncharacterized protein LOC135313338 [Phalacrocorax carbo]|uniref:uncharacterized protein LOC135313338 n=1 Tax=Phalacrocorax carbo TaxID=9209 RepID=UPI0031197EE2
MTLTAPSVYEEHGSSHGCESSDNKLPCVPSCLSLTARCLAFAGSQKGRGTARRSSEHILPHAGRPRSPQNSIAVTLFSNVTDGRVDRGTAFSVPCSQACRGIWPRSRCLPSGICLATDKYLPKILHSGFHLPDSDFSLHKSVVGQTGLLPFSAELPGTGQRLPPESPNRRSALLLARLRWVSKGSVSL